jgi:hypothetical protein
VRVRRRLKHCLSDEDVRGVAGARDSGRCEEPKMGQHSLGGLS